MVRTCPQQRGLAELRPEKSLVRLAQRPPQIARMERDTHTANTKWIELRIEDGFWLHKTAVQPAALTV